MARRNKNKDDLLDLSEWMTKHTDFFVIRRFEVLNARIVLKLQTEICVLEENLSRLDRGRNDDGKVGDPPRSFLEDSHGRKRLLDDLEDKLSRYSKQRKFSNNQGRVANYYPDTYVTTYSQIQARTNATAQQIENIRKWVHRYSAISPFETNFISERDKDLITLCDGNSTHFRKLILVMAEAYTSAQV
jgi:hypothetical protein